VSEATRMLLNASAMLRGPRVRIRFPLAESPRLWGIQKLKSDRVTAQPPISSPARPSGASGFAGIDPELLAGCTISKSQVHLTSCAVNGLPSCHLTPCRSGKVSAGPSSFHDQLVARSGTID